MWSCSGVGLVFGGVVVADWLCERRGGQADEGFKQVLSCGMHLGRQFASSFGEQERKAGPRGFDQYLDLRAIRRAGPYIRL